MTRSPHSSYRAEPGVTPKGQVSQTDSSKQQTNWKTVGHGGEGELSRPWACSHDKHTVGHTEDPATMLPRHAHFLKRKKGGILK